jgi:O-antigen/teichoic acid export membrane protein
MQHDADRGLDLDDGRDETEMERLDRNTVELLNELRVASVGIQVLFAFLLVVPFNTGFKQVSSFDRYDYFVTLLCIATAAALLIAPSIHHRLLFRRHEKAYVVAMGTRLTIIGMMLLTVGLTGILVLISHVMFGAATAIVVGICAAMLVSALWFAIPLRRRRKK